MLELVARKGEIDTVGRLGIVQEGDGSAERFGWKRERVTADEFEGLKLRSRRWFNSGSSSNDARAGWG